MPAQLDTALTLDGEPLDLVLWRNRGRTQGLVEQTLGLNPGLADFGAVLPGGRPVLLPSAAAAQPVRETVKLWG